MKYEIIKGSERDFEGAPENTLTVYSLKGSRRTHLSPYRADEFAVGVEIIAERRPITEPVVNQQLTTEWDGEGLPPIGCVCEYRGNDTSWGEVKIIGHDEGKVVFKPSGEDYYGITPSHKAEFIPIRSPEDVARSNTIGEMERAYEDLTGKPAREAEEYYDFIAAGKIPGITKTPTVSELMHVTESATREDCEAIIKMMGGIK